MARASSLPPAGRALRTKFKMRIAVALCSVLAVLAVTMGAGATKAEAMNYDSAGLNFTYGNYRLTTFQTSHQTLAYCMDAALYGPGSYTYHYWSWVSDMSESELGCNPNALAWLIENGYPFASNILGVTDLNRGSNPRNEPYNVTQLAIWMLLGDVDDNGYMPSHGWTPPTRTTTHIWLARQLKNEALKHSGYNPNYNHWLKLWRYYDNRNGGMQRYIEILPYNPRGSVTIHKTSSEAASIGVINDNQIYTMQGAHYGIWNSSGSKVADVTLDSNGNATTGNLSAGTYYIHETATPSSAYNLDTATGTSWSHGASAGYNDSGWHSVTVSAGNTSICNVDEDMKDMPQIAVQKLDAQTGTKPQYDGDFKMTARVEYFDNLNGDVSGTAKRRWSVQTNDAGYALLDSSTVLAGSDSLYTYNGKTVAPAGTYRVTEIMAPSLYDPNTTPVVKVIQPGSGTNVISISLTDTIKQPGNLSIGKNTIYSKKTNIDFTFNVTLTTFKDNPYKDSVSAVTYDKSGKTVSKTTLKPDATGMVTVKIRKDQRIQLNDLHPGTKYSVKEVNIPAGFAYTSNASQLTGSVESGNTISFTADNTYHATGSATFTGKKVTKGHSLEAGRWSFVVTDSNGNNVATGSNDAAGNVKFSAINYTEQDIDKTYTYTIREISASGNGWTTDTHTVTATVKVTDNGNGTLNCAVSYSTGSTPTWTNSYTSNGSAQLTAHKSMSDGSKPKEGAYSFQLYKLSSASDKGGTLIQTKTNNASGNVYFDTLKYDQNDAGKTYYYGVREVKGTDTNITYDTSFKVYKVVCADDGLGHIQATPYLLSGSTWDEASAASFTNIKKPGELTIEKEVEGTADDTIFTFKVTISGPNVNDDTVKSYSVTSKDGSRSYGHDNSTTDYPND